jgi:hypothetical protein
MQLIVKGMEELQRNLAVDIPKQIRFAEMQTINDVALAVQKHEIETQLPKKFTLRSKGAPWWKPGTRFGINIRPFATKTNLRAVVGSQADWLKLQEEGGTKKAEGHRLAVESGARPTEASVLPSAVKPRKLLARVGNVTMTRTGKTRVTRRNGRGFIIQTKNGPVIFVREPGGLKAMYHLEGTARIPAILEFKKSGEALAVRIFQTIFEQRFQRAIATARPI